MKKEGDDMYRIRFHGDLDDLIFGTEPNPVSEK
jgi:hypothetical protein